MALVRLIRAPCTLGGVLDDWHHEVTIAAGQVMYVEALDEDVLVVRLNPEAGPDIYIKRDILPRGIVLTEAAFTLVDDGTIDTVLECDDCGEQLRYTTVGFGKNRIDYAMALANNDHDCLEREDETEKEETQGAYQEEANHEGQDSSGKGPHM